MEEKGWSILATYSSGLDADIAMGQLEQAGIPALRDNNSAAGIFGFSFQGTTPQGFTVRVPTDALEDARAVVILPEDIV
jgi:putative signal transducing protein